MMPRCKLYSVECRPKDGESLFMTILLARALVEDNIAEHVCMWFDGACVEVTQFDSVHSVKQKVEQCTHKHYE